MIGNLINGPGIEVRTDGSGAMPYLSNAQDNDPGIGQMRLRNSNIEVWTGTIWQTWYQRHVTVALDHRTQEILAWADSERQRQQSLKSSMDQHPGLREAYEKFEIMRVLCEQQTS